MEESSSRDSLEEDLVDSSGPRTDKWMTSLSNSLGRMAESTQSVIRNLNLVGSLSILAALVSLWLDFRGAYTATIGAVDELNPVIASLLPAALVGLTVFVTVWCAVYAVHYVRFLRARLVSGMEVRAGLKKLGPDIETCLFFLEKIDQVEDGWHQDLLLRYISEIGHTLWEEMLTLGLDGPTTYSIRSALPAQPAHDADKPDVAELQRLLKVLAPLARARRCQGSPQDLLMSGRANLTQTVATPPSE